MFERFKKYFDIETIPQKPVENAADTPKKKPIRFYEQILKIMSEEKITSKPDKDSGTKKRLDEL